MQPEEVLIVSFLFCRIFGAISVVLSIFALFPTISQIKPGGRARSAFLVEGGTSVQVQVGFRLTLAYIKVYATPSLPITNFVLSAPFPYTHDSGDTLPRRYIRTFLIQKQEPTRWCEKVGPVVFINAHVGNHESESAGCVGATERSLERRAERTETQGRARGSWSGQVVWSAYRWNQRLLLGGGGGGVVELLTAYAANAPLDRP
ncbi:hypothetical protein DM02DRAFT_701671 [Periconia macrospinosa]|uniref:Uncharacterized protein n=1 Tax=Periconia macrospinosa TaxID=97972 RepID=A0A2V1DYS0_9PLEO|nr:hypothetical protein DM02DRAFT_701671 [Periconia macrospinosa]